MTHSTPTEAAMRDGSDLVDWAEPNWVANNDERIEAAVRRGLHGPVPVDLAQHVPLFRFANSDLPPMTLVEAVMDPPRHDHRTCDRCLSSKLSVLDRLWVPCDGSVVEVAVCWRCKVDLDRALTNRSSLVWCEPWPD